METDSRPFVVGPREGRFIDLSEFGMTIKASADETIPIACLPAIS
jgi:hypothetical protein